MVKLAEALAVIAGCERDETRRLHARLALMEAAAFGAEEKRHNDARRARNGALRRFAELCVLVDQRRNAVV